VTISVTDTPGKRRRRKRETRPEIDRRAERPFNGDTATRLVADPYSTTGGKIAVTASLRDDPLGKLYARRQIDDAQYRVRNPHRMTSGAQLRVPPEQARWPKCGTARLWAGRRRLKLALFSPAPPPRPVSIHFLGLISWSKTPRRGRRGLATLL
jgi:hypothetical protein